MSYHADIKGEEPQDMELVQAEFTSLINPPYSLYRSDGGGDRWYWCPEAGRHFPSVTNVIGATVPAGAGLIQFFKNENDADAVADERAAYGTFMHKMINALLLSESFDLGALPDLVRLECAEAGYNAYDQWLRDIQKDILAFHAFRIEHEVEPIAVEIPLASKTMNVAGAVDLVCDMLIGSGKYASLTAGDKKNGTATKERCLVDYKSGRKGFYETHEYQLHLYKPIWEENYPELPIDRVLNWAPSDWVSSPSYKLKDQTESKYAANIPHLLSVFHNNRSGPGRRMKVSGVIKPDTPVSELFAFVDPSVPADA